MAERRSSTARSKPAAKRRPSGKASESRARKLVIEIARAVSDQGLSPGRSGNVSLRWRQGMLITPSGMAYDSLEANDIVFVNGDGATQPKARKPSSEWRFHLAAYDARPDREAVVHTHSLYATALACQHRAIPAFHYMVAVAGGTEVPCIPYAAFGTVKLARHVARGLAEHDACLMANHGQIAMGRSLEGALELANEIETLAAQYVQVLSIGKPKLLSKTAMADVLKRFQSYGQNAQKS
ncbi:MAG: class II aldolase/adducin family protein [Hyphomicrobiaceae bacterium]